MTVLVLDGNKPASLTMVRSLGRHGIPVHVGERHRYSLSTHSKYCSGQVTYADPEESREDFIGDLRRLLSVNDYEMVLSSREATTYPLSYRKEALETDTTIPYPDWDHLRLTVDKSRTFEIADEIGVPTPETYHVEDPEGLAVLNGELDYPLVVKPCSKTTWVDDRPVKMKVTGENYVDTFEELVDVATRIHEAVGVMPLVQEYVPGEGFGVELLCNGGDAEAVFMHRRLREYPITGGASTYRESIYDPALERPAVRLLGEMEWHGVGMVEFRLDRRDNVPKLIEVNGRFWGSLPLAIAAGIEFPYLLYRLYRDESLPDVEYETGVTCRWLLPGDVLWLVSTLKNDQVGLATLREFASFRRDHYDVLSRDDPRPAAGALVDAGRQAVSVIRGEKTIAGETKA